MWPEVEKAKAEKRCEIVLSGPKINERLERSGLDSALFDLTALNYLSFSETVLSSIPDEISKLTNLQTLVFHHNKLSELNLKVFDLEKLKVLDVSRNLLKEIPAEIEKLKQLTSLNASSNQLEVLPGFSKNTKLAVLNLADNKLKEFPDVCYGDLSVLADVLLNANEIENIPNTISNVSMLKNLDISSNKLKILPGELADCSKVKDINLKGNPIADRRLLKLIDQCRTKQIMDYVRQHCPKTVVENAGGESKKNKKGGGGKQDDSGEKEDKRYKIQVQHCTDDSIKVVILEEVKAVRGHFSACVVKNVEFTEETFKKFIQLQTKLHDGVCQKRTVATIATHDLKKIGPGYLTYTAKAPKDLKIIPLNRSSNMSGAQLFARLQTEAENLRKEKKRNVYSGIHKYLYLLEGQKMYPCLLNENNDVISFPPITNSEISKISQETTSIFLEVTSAASQGSSKQVMDALLKEMVYLFGKGLTIQQVKNVDLDGNLKFIYPSRNDLLFEEDVPIKVCRE